MSFLRTNYRSIPGFPGAQWFDFVCKYCNGKADSYWKCPGKANHKQSHQGQVLPPIGQVVPVPFDGDWERLKQWGKPRDGQPSHCGVPALFMADSRPWWSEYHGPCWYCPVCESASLWTQGWTRDWKFREYRGWCNYALTDEERNPITFKEQP